MTKEYLDEYERNRKNYKYEVNKLEKEIYLEYKNTTVDSVVGSSKTFPYIRGHKVIEGINNKKIERLEKRKAIYKKKLKKIDKELKYRLDNLEDREIADILEQKYKENRSFVQITHKMNEKSDDKIYTVDGIRMQVKRFFEKN